MLAVFEKFANKQLSGGRGTIAEPTVDLRAKAIRDAREELAVLRAEQEKLDAAMSASSGNVTAQVDAYKRMSQAVNLAEEQVRKLELAQRLSDTRGQRTGFARWIAGYENSTKYLAKVAEENDKSNRKTLESAGKMAKQRTRDISSYRQLATETNRAAQATNLFGKETRTTLSFMQRMRGEVIALTASYIGLFGAYQRVVEAANAYRAVERAQQNLGVAFDGDLNAVRQEMSFLNAEADRLGFTFQSLADGYGKISVAAQGAGFSISDTRKLFISIIEASRVSGQSVEQTTGILRAFEQILSKGKIQAEELRGQLGDRMTGAFKLFADALGVTTAELDAMMKAGEVLADRDTLIKIAERLSAVYSGELPRALASVGFAMDNFGRSIEKINLLMAEGLVESIKEASASLAAFVDSAEGQDFFRGIGEAAGAIISTLAMVPEYLDLIGFAVKALIAIKVAQWASQFGSSIIAIVGNVARLNNEMTMIGPRMQQMSSSQALFANALNATNGALLRGQRNLRSYAASGLLARTGVTAVSASLGFLRVALAVTATAARAMWAAVGGPVGIAVVAISTIYANWETDADRASAALQGHEAILWRVQEAYGKAQGKVKDWRDELEGLTKLDAEVNLAKLEASYAEAIDNISSDLNIFKNMLSITLNDPSQSSDPVFVGELKQISGILDDLEKGVVPIDNIKSALSELSDSTQSESIREAATYINDLINAADQNGTSILSLSKATETARNVLGLFAEESKETSEEALGLQEVVEDVNTTFGDTKPLKEYLTAINELRGAIPSLSEEMEYMGKINALAKLRDDAVAAARSWREAADAVRLYNQGMDELRLERDRAEGERTRAATGSFASKVVTVESGGVTDATNSNSSATGLGQFIEETWLSMFKKYFPDRAATLTDAAILELRKNGETSIQMIDLYAQENAEILRRAGVEINDANLDANLYLAHFLGAGGASKVLLADRTTPVSEILGSDQIAANPTVLGDGATAGEVIDWARQKMGISETELAIIGEMSKADQERLKIAQEQAQATKDRLTELDLELEKQGLINQGQEREAAILQAMNDARAENPSITEGELALLREKTALLYDQQNAQNGIELSEERVNQLYELRSQLTEQMNMANANGDTVGAEGLRVEIETVDLKLKEAIQSAIALWAAIGGPEADVAVAKLKTMEMSLQTTQVKLGGFGISMDTWYGVFQNAVQGTVAAFEAFAQAIVNGENAFAAFGRAALQVLAQVLQQIAATIIQMQILKALQGFGGGIGGFATTMLKGMTGHTGGVVGSSAIGGGNAIGRPDWMRSALTYHTGGMAGFAPDEVSATLKKGEEILTEEDPRHRNNLGGSTSADKGGRLTQVLAIGEKQVMDMMNRYGKDAVLTHIKSEAPTIRRMLGV